MQKGARLLEVSYHANGGFCLLGCSYNTSDDIRSFQN